MKTHRADYVSHSQPYSARPAQFLLLRLPTQPPIPMTHLRVLCNRPQQTSKRVICPPNQAPALWQTQHNPLKTHQTTLQTHQQRTTARGERRSGQSRPSEETKSGDQACHGDRSKNARIQKYLGISPQQEDIWNEFIAGIVNTPRPNTEVPRGINYVEYAEKMEEAQKNR